MSLSSGKVGVDPDPINRVVLVFRSSQLVMQLVVCKVPQFKLSLTLGQKALLRFLL